MITIKVIDYIDKHPQAKPKEIAASTGLTVKQINNVLYRYRRTINPDWRLAYENRS